MPTAIEAWQVPSEHARPASQGIEPIAVRQEPPRAPSATQVEAPLAVTQVEPMAQMVVPPIGSHAAPTAAVVTSVTVSSNVPCSARPESAGV